MRNLLSDFNNQLFPESN